MSKIQESIEVKVPVRTAYDQWTQFEDFPRFMEGVERVVQLDDTTLEWTARIAGKEESWRATITTQEPDREVAWQATSGARNDGDVRFQPVGQGSTRIDLTMDVEPEGPVESTGDALGFVQRRVKADLERFKEFIEQRGQETGAWRGEVSGGQVSPDTRSMGRNTGPTAHGTGAGTSTGSTGLADDAS